ncbi:hypothetical protein NDU88_000219, partial [Pleurodeles waltl]
AVAERLGLAVGWRGAERARSALAVGDGVLGREAVGEYIREYCESGEAAGLLRLSSHLGDRLMGETCPDDAALDREESLGMETTGDGALSGVGRCSAPCG